MPRPRQHAHFAIGTRHPARSTTACAAHARVARALGAGRGLRRGRRPVRRIASFAAGTSRAARDGGPRGGTTPRAIDARMPRARAAAATRALCDRDASSGARHARVRCTSTWAGRGLRRGRRPVPRIASFAAVPHVQRETAAARRDLVEQLRDEVCVHAHLLCARGTITNMP